MEMLVTKFSNCSLNIFWQEGPHPPHVKRCHFNLDFLLTKHQYTLAASFEVTKSLQQENESGFLYMTCPSLRLKLTLFKRKRKSVAVNKI